MDYARKRLKLVRHRPEPQQRQKFLGEVRTIQLLNEAGCPNIVSVVDAELSPGGEERPWFVMPLYRAGTMSDHLGDYKGDIPRVLATVRDIARTLDFIHGLTERPHRDVKTNNIFFDAVGGPPVLGDFGLAYWPDADGPETALGETLGPARWRPPELRAGSPNKRHCGTDVYQLGGVIYEALTGGDVIDDIEQPGRYFRHELPELTIERFVTDDYRVEAVNRLLRHMFRQDPGQRFTAARVGAACEEILAWSPGNKPPEFPVSNEADEAAARYHARRRTSELETIRAELKSTCQAVEEHFNLRVDAPPHQVSRRVDVNRGDPEPFGALKRKYPQSEWRAVRVRVRFEAANLDPMSYVFVGRLDPQREMVGVYNESKEWRELAECVPGSPKQVDIMLKAVGEELDRLNKDIAAKIDRLN